MNIHRKRGKYTVGTLFRKGRKIMLIFGTDADYLLEGSTGYESAKTKGR